MKEIQISIGGNPYTLAQLTASDSAALMAEWKAAAPDPVRQLLDTAGQLPDTLKDEFIRKHIDGAFEKKNRTGTLNDTEFQAYLSTIDGATKVLHRMLRKHHPHLTPSQALDIVAEGIAEHGEDFLSRAVGGKPAGADQRN